MMKRHPQSPLTKTIVVLSEHNAKRILNQALANVQKKCLEVYANLHTYNEICIHLHKTCNTKNICFKGV